MPCEFCGAPRREDVETDIHGAAVVVEVHPCMRCDLGRKRAGICAVCPKPLPTDRHRATKLCSDACRKDRKRRIDRECKARTREGSEEAREANRRSAAEWRKENPERYRAGVERAIRKNPRPYLAAIERRHSREKMERARARKIRGTMRARYGAKNNPEYAESARRAAAKQPRCRGKFVKQGRVEAAA